MTNNNKYLDRVWQLIRVNIHHSCILHFFLITLQTYTHTINFHLFISCLIVCIFWETMASVSATFLCSRPSLRFPVKIENQMMSKSLRLETVGYGRTGGFPRIRTSRLQITCAAAKQETVDKVCEIVRKQLALPPEKEITPQTTFSDLGADSLDTVEIVMGLEEEFDITVQEDNQDNINCIQEAADLIEQLVAKKS